MDAAAAAEFIGAPPRAVLATFRRDGRPQLAPVTAAVDTEGRVIISTRETAVKVRNLRRDPRVSLVAFTDRFYGDWVQVEGSAEIVAMPDALELLVDYYRRVAGEHPDWDEYRAGDDRGPPRPASFHRRACRPHRQRLAAGGQFADHALVQVGQQIGRIGPHLDGTGRPEFGLAQPRHRSGR